MRIIPNQNVRALKKKSLAVAVLQFKSSDRTLTPALSHPMKEGELLTRLSFMSPPDSARPSIASLSHRMGEGQGEGGFQSSTE
jgi:hypothetical protein